MNVWISCLIVLSLFLLSACHHGPKNQGSKAIDRDAVITQNVADVPENGSHKIDSTGLKSEELSENYSELQAVFFDYDKSDIRTDQVDILQANARILTQLETKRVQIEGHCDERGTEEYNLALGDRRARMVKEYLSSLGIPPERLGTISYGEARPFEKEHDEEAWSQNRRAHFVKENRN